MHRLLAAACLILANLLKLHLGNWNNHMLHSEESFDRVRISASNVFSLNLPPMKTCCRGIRQKQTKGCHLWTVELVVRTRDRGAVFLISPIRAVLHKFEVKQRSVKSGVDLVCIDVVD